MAKFKFNDIEAAEHATDLILGAECALVITDKGGLISGRGRNLIAAVTAHMASNSDLREIIKNATEVLEGDNGKMIMEFMNFMKRINENRDCE